MHHTLRDGKPAFSKHVRTSECAKQAVSSSQSQQAAAHFAPPPPSPSSSLALQTLIVRVCVCKVRLLPGVLEQERANTKIGWNYLETCLPVRGMDGEAGGVCSLRRCGKEHRGGQLYAGRCTGGEDHGQIQVVRCVVSRDTPTPTGWVYKYIDSPHSTLTTKPTSTLCSLTF